jgi:hypothetical protein
MMHWGRFLLLHLSLLEHRHKNKNVGAGFVSAQNHKKCKILQNMLKKEKCIGRIEATKRDNTVRL